MTKSLFGQSLKTCKRGSQERAGSPGTTLKTLSLTEPSLLRCENDSSYLDTFASSHSSINFTYPKVFEKAKVTLILPFQSVEVIQ